MAKLTIRDIAALPGLSKSTVSLVLNNSPRVDYAVIKAAANAGLRGPVNLSVIGFDDVESASKIHPPLTTIRQPFTEMGRRAADLLLEAIREGDEAIADPSDATAGGAAPMRLTMPTNLIVRASCGPAPVTRERRGRPAAAQV
jgi:LacI family transcriptional regulator